MVDSTSNIDEYNLGFFLLCTHCVAGDEQEATLIEALQLIFSCFPEQSFYDRHKLGPRTFMTDNCDKLRSAIGELWPEFVLLLCQFHILQQVW